MGNKTSSESARKWGKTPDGKYEIVALTKETMGEAMHVMRDGFFSEETVSVACELTTNKAAVEELEDMVKHVANDGISLIAVEISTGKVAAVSFNTFEYPDEDDYFVNLQKMCKTPNAKCLLQFMIDMANECDVFKEYNAKVLIEVMFLATLKEHRGHGIAKALFEATIQVARRIKGGEDVRMFVGPAKVVLPRPTLVTALCSSFITQNIVQKLGFENVKIVSFDKWSFNGKSFAEVIGTETIGTTIDCFVL